MNSPLEKDFLSREASNQMQGPRPSSAIGILAFLLILSGLFLLIYLLRELYFAYQQPAANLFLLNIKEAITTKTLFSQEGSPPYMIGEGGAIMVAIVIFILFASLIFSVAIGLVRAGTQILSPNFDEKIQQLKLRVNVLTKNQGNSKTT
ncbi:MAG: hypothetical protein LBI48_08485 [Burkholderiaceae bacterium]|jgi:hypothetical protein|nr:hypothetical protein [Burkholderiaceae bacterium]